MRSEYDANRAMAFKNEMQVQVETNNRVRAEVARIRAQLAEEKRREYKLLGTIARLRQRVGF